MIEDAWRVVGGRPLRGTVTPAGSKNGALPTLAATLLLEGEAVLHNVPRILDVECMEGLLRAFGMKVARRRDGSVHVVNHGLETNRAPLELVRRMRASHYLLAPVVARLGRAEIPFPGGCAIGERPVDYLLSGLHGLGVESQVDDERIRARARRLVGADIALDPVYRSPGATFTLLMAAVLAEGTTTIENASFEPDVVSFCQFLNGAGAQIEGSGTPALTVRGVPSLHGVTHTINPDRLEAGTFFCAAAASRGEVTVENITLPELGAVVEKLQEAGVEIAQSSNGVTASCERRPRAISLVTEPYPRFPTDLQPPMGAMLATAEGVSTIREAIFDRRLQYVPELAKMGADIRLVDSRNAVITGVPRLHGAEVEGQSIRDGAALVVAALGAEGESIVSGRHLVARGYEALEMKLRALGAEIEVRG